MVSPATILTAQDTADTGSLTYGILGETSLFQGVWWNDVFVYAATPSSADSVQVDINTAGDGAISGGPFYFSLTADDMTGDAMPDIPDYDNGSAGNKQWAITHVTPLSDTRAAVAASGSYQTTGSGPGTLYVYTEVIWLTDTSGEVVGGPCISAYYASAETDETVTHVYTDTHGGESRTGPCGIITDGEVRFIGFNSDDVYTRSPLQIYQAGDANNLQQGTYHSDQLAVLDASGCTFVDQSSGQRTTAFAAYSDSYTNSSTTYGSIAITGSGTAIACVYNAGAHDWELVSANGSYPLSLSGYDYVWISDFNLVPFDGGIGIMRAKIETTTCGAIASETVEASGWLFNDAGVAPVMTDDWVMLVSSTPNTGFGID